ncbi:MAG: hypothetical protein AB7K67_16540 [Hyphomicrobiaceae bacterium]|jgi:hypothetical protein
MSIRVECIASGVTASIEKADRRQRKIPFVESTENSQSEIAWTRFGRKKEGRTTMKAKTKAKKPAKAAKKPAKKKK